MGEERRKAMDGKGLVLRIGFQLYARIPLPTSLRSATPIAVPGVRLADSAAALHTDRGYSLRSLYLPQAALPSLPPGGRYLGGWKAEIIVNCQLSIVNYGLPLRRCAPPPIAVPGVRLADGAAALHTDRGHSLGTLLPPPAALPSLPTSFARLSR